MADILENLNEDERYFVKMALKYARKSNLFRQHGCVIVNPKANNRYEAILSYGYNHREKYHDDEQENRKKNSSRDIYIHKNNSFHAEMDAISRLKKKYRQMRLVMYLVKVDPKDPNKVQFSRPCSKCAEKLIEYCPNISIIYYSWHENSPYCNDEMFIKSDECFNRLI